MPAPFHRMGLLWGPLMVLLAALALPTSAHAESPPDLSTMPIVWIVQLNYDPAASYDGSKPGFKATTPAAREHVPADGRSCPMSLSLGRLLVQLHV